MQSRPPFRQRVLEPFAVFAEMEAASGILLMICAAVALIWANSPWAASYFNLWETKLSISVGNATLGKSLLHWINDGLMAIFFTVVGLEIKRELVVGELNSAKKAMLPIVAAFGGMVVPALIFVALNTGREGVRGWGIPMATDIAFALGVLALAGKGVPFALKVFLAAVAIVDDIGAVLVIAVFYTSEIAWRYLGYGAVVLVLLLLMNRCGIRRLLPYGLLGACLWFCFLKSGIHATVAGVLLAFTIPTRVHLQPKRFLDESREALDHFAEQGVSEDHVLMTSEQQNAVQTLEVDCERVQMPLDRAERALHPWVTFLIIPIFALANSGVSFGSNLLQTFSSPTTLGVIAGLVLGKPIGIVLCSWLAVRGGWGSLPEGVRWRHVAGAGAIAGVGFTMSLFITDLAFDSPTLAAMAKVGILTASLVAGVAGWLLVRRTTAT